MVMNELFLAYRKLGVAMNLIMGYNAALSGRIATRQKITGDLSCVLKSLPFFFRAFLSQLVQHLKKLSLLVPLRVLALQLLPVAMWQLAHLSAAALHLHAKQVTTAKSLASQLNYTKIIHGMSRSRGVPFCLSKS